MIPYTTERRADTGVSNVTMGIWLFLASEVMLFGSVFSSYALLRAAAPAWPSGPDVLDVRFGLVNTALLVAVSAAAWRARTVSPAWRTLVLAGSAFALAFLGVKAVEYRGEIAAGLVPATSTFFALYFLLTGLHAAHVIGGLVANAWVLAGARRVGPAMTEGRLRAISLYWVFVDLVWLVILWLLYFA
jgi:heme/copper-type cytochrome/quinol oxidase subunit 3